MLGYPMWMIVTAGVAAAWLLYAAVSKVRGK